MIHVDSLGKFFALISFLLINFSSTTLSAATGEAAQPGDRSRDYEVIGSPQHQVYLTDYYIDASVTTHTLYRGKLSLDPDPKQSEVVVPFYYYKSRIAGPRPVLFIPPNLQGITAMEKGAAIYFATKGVSSLLFDPAYPIQDPSRTTDELGSMFKMALLNLKMLVDWAESRPEEFDRDKFGAFGMSLGGIMSSVLLGQDSRIKAGYLVVAGGDLPSILSRADERFLNTYRSRRIREEGLSGVQEFEEVLRQKLEVDPMKPALKRNPDNIFMIIGLGDKIVPTRNQMLLWRFLGKPKFRYAHMGHMGGVMKVPFALDYILLFFKNRWKGSSENKEREDLPMARPLDTEFAEGGSSPLIPYKPHLESAEV